MSFLHIRFSDQQAVASAFSKGGGGFRFIRVLSTQGDQIRIVTDAGIFTVSGQTQLKAGQMYRARLLKTESGWGLQIAGSEGKEGTAVSVSDHHHSRLQKTEVRTLKQLWQQVSDKISSEGKPAAAEFFRNHLTGSGERLEAFFADLFSCRFDKPEIAEQLDLFNACGTPPQFRSIVPFDWNGIRGYLDLLVIGSRLISYRFRILSPTADLLLHIDPIGRSVTVDRFSEASPDVQDFKLLNVFSEYTVRGGKNIPDALAYAESAPFCGVDQWM